MQSETIMGNDIFSIPCMRSASSRLLKSFDDLSEILRIWTETRNDGDTLRIRKKGVN